MGTAFDANPRALARKHHCEKSFTGINFLTCEAKACALLSACVLKIETKRRYPGGEKMALQQSDPHAYLETEARIIAENDTHAVIAVRLDKSMIARNLLFLAALSDMIPALKSLSALPK